MSVAVGPLLSGGLIAWLGGDLGWRATFLVNVPIALGALIVARQWLPRTVPERAATTVSFYRRARAFFAAHGITVDRVITDNGNNYRAADFTAKVVSLGGRHHRIRPYTPRHNGKVERYNRLMVDEVLYARPYTSEQARREALAVWVNHYNYHRPHTSCGDAPPASLAPTRVNNVMPSYT